MLFAAAAIVAWATVALIRHLKTLRGALEQATGTLREALDEVNAEARKASEGLERLTRFRDRSE